MAWHVETRRVFHLSGKVARKIAFAVAFLQTLIINLNRAVHTPRQSR